MDGERLKTFLEVQGIAAKALAAALGVSPQTVSTYLKTGNFKNSLKEKLAEAIDLPEGFFDNSMILREDNVAYGNAGALVECEKEKAVLEETVRQLELRISEKDSVIKLLSKQITK